MAIKYLKKSPKTSSTDDSKTAEIVQGLLNDLEKSKEQGCILVLLISLNHLIDLEQFQQFLSHRLMMF